MFEDMFVFRYSKCMGAVVLLSNFNNLKLKNKSVFSTGLGGTNARHIVVISGQ